MQVCERDVNSFGRKLGFDSLLSELNFKETNRNRIPVSPLLFLSHLYTSRLIDMRRHAKHRFQAPE
jgi:hypothetical protein